MRTQSQRGAELLEQARKFFADLRELEKTNPHDVDVLVGAVVEHVRSWKPVALLPVAGETLRVP